MTRDDTAISWPWVAGAFAIYVVTEVVLGGLLSGLLTGFVSWPFRMRLEVLLMAASWWLGGLLVGLISPKVRLVEPAIAAALAVLLTMLYAVFVPIGWFRISLGRAAVGSAIAFGLALWGADTGERLAARMGNKASRDYAGRG